jgi:hypothetical protein
MLPEFFPVVPLGLTFANFCDAGSPADGCFPPAEAFAITTKSDFHLS